MTVRTTPDIWLPPHVTPIAVAEAVEAFPGEPRTIVRQWVDTFDWTLREVDLTIEVDTSATAPPTTTLRRLSTNAVLLVVEAPPPRTQDEIIDGPWRRHLGTTLGLRALFPVAEAELSVTELRLWDDEGKTVAMVLLDTGHRRGTWARPVPVRGHDDEFRHLCETLAGIDGARPAPPFVIGTELRVPPPGARPRRTPLDPDMPAIEGFRRMLGDQLHELAANEPFLVEPLDTEFLHDYRVALRRTRSILKRADGILPAEGLATWKARLREIQQATAPSRDLDVFLLEFDEYAELLDPAHRPDLEPLRAHLVELDDAAHAAMIIALGRDHAATLADFGAWVAGAEPTDGADAAEPLAAVAVARITRSHRRLVKRAAAVTDDAPAEAVHEVRIAAKELRYGLEVFGGVLRKKPAGKLVRRLKRLQDCLGAFQDAEVHAEMMDDLAGAVLRAGVPVQTLLAMGQLRTAFLARQADARADFAERWAEFNTGETSALLHALHGGNR